MKIRKIKNKYARGVILLPLFAAGAISSQALAVELQAEFSAGVGRSDNITRAPDNEIDETIGNLGLTLNASQEGSRLEYDITSNLNYRTYADDTFDSQLVGGVNALATLSLARDRLHWIAINNFGQRTIDPLVAPTPANREDVNFLTTGPSFRLPMGRRNQIGIEALYSRVNYEVRPLDNDKKEARLWFSREVRRGMNFSVNARTLQSEFDDTLLNENFDTHEGFVRFERPASAGRSGYEIDLGYSRLDFESTGDESGPLLRLEVTRFIGTYTNLAFLAGTGYTDPAALFRFNQNADFAGGATQNIDGSGVPFRRDYANVSYNYNFERTSFSIGGGLQKQDYNGRTTLDRNVIVATAQVRRNLSRKVFASLGASFANQDYELIDRDDRTVAANFQIGYRIGTTMTIATDFEHTRRTSNDPLAKYDENRVFVRFTYTPRWDTPPQQP